MRFLVAIILFALPAVSSAYEPTQTHAGLTEQVVEFYNLQFDNKITAEQKELMVKGAMEEDDPVTRALNHFYDPIRNIGIEGGRTAKEWALGDLVTNDFGWKEALAAYARGDTDTAFVALGHVIHLIEDMGVPDHTRNDQHVPFLDENLGGHSPYEDWAMKEKNRQTMQGVAQGFVSDGVLPKLFSQPGEYFDFLAKYSNRNFFSRDTIFRQDIYLKPQVISYEQDYGYWIDEISKEKAPVVKRKKQDDGNITFALRDKNDTSILSSYFDRLSRQIIPSGAGVVELFFKEGEKARAVYQEELRKKQEAEAQAGALLNKRLSRGGFTGVLSYVWYGTGHLVNNYVVTPLSNYIVRPVGNGLALTGRWVFEEPPVAVNTGKFVATATTIAAKDAVVTGGKFVVRKAGEGLTIIQQTVSRALSAPLDPRGQVTGLVSMNNNNASPSTNIEKSNPLQEIFVFKPEASAGIPKLVFVGSFTSVSGGGGGTPPQAASQNQVLGTQEEALQTEEETATTEEVLAEHEGATGAAIAAPALSAPQCASSLATDGCLLATTTVRFEWAPVSGASFYSVSKNGAYATTTETAHDIIIPDFSDYTFEVATVSAGGETSATSTKTISVASIPIAINEVAWMGTLASVTDEWFELKNNTAYTIDLNQWVVEAEDGTPRVKLSGVIAPREYLVFERTDDGTIADIVAHAVYTGALGNTGEHLTLSYASTTLDQTPRGAWSAGYNSTTTKQTMERYASKEPGVDPANWGTNLAFISSGTDAIGNPTDGTPGARNSVSYLINKGQDITSDLTLTVGEGAYVLFRETTIPASTTLTLEPGVTVLFRGYGYGGYYEGSFFIQGGTIDARGTAENPVVFSTVFSEQAGDFWFQDSTGTSTFDHVLFDNIGDIGVDNARVEIRNADFMHTDGGVNLYNGATAIVENSRFTDLTNDGFGAYDASTLTIASTTINGVRGDVLGAYERSTVAITNVTIRDVSDGDGIGAYGGSRMTIASTTIDGVLDGDGVGLYSGSVLAMSGSTIDGVYDGDGLGVYESTLTIASSTIKNISDNGIVLYDATSTISHTVVENIGENGIDIYGGVTSITDTTVTGATKGVGILISAPWEPVVVTGGEVADNSVGVSMDVGSVVLTDVSVHDNGEDIMVQ